MYARAVAASIFISYSRVDREFALRLRDALEADSRDVFLDVDDIPPTAAFMEEIRRAIESSDAFAFLISPDSVQSKVCNEEIDIAAALRKRLVPVVVREVPAPQVPVELREINWLWFLDSDPFNSFFERLLEVIDTDLDWVRGHSRLLVRASEWRRQEYDESYLLRGSDLEAATAWLAEAADKRPDTAPLHHDYLRASQEAQAREVERLRAMYRNALARQLAAQAALLHNESHALLDRAMLLAAESLARVPTAEADSVVRAGLELRAREIAVWQLGDDTKLLEASPCGRWLAGSVLEDGVAIFANNDFQTVAARTFEGRVAALCFSSSGDHLFVAEPSGRLLEWSFEKDAPDALRPVGHHPGHVHSLHVVSSSDSGGSLLLSVGEKCALCWQTDEVEILWDLELESRAWAVASTEDGARVAVGAGDCAVRLVDGATGEVQYVLQHDAQRPVAILERGASDAGIVDVAFLESAGLLVSAGLDGTVRAWDVDTGEMRFCGHHRRDLLCLAVHDGRGLAASGALDKTLIVWHPESGVELARLPHQAAVTSLAFSDNGLWLASACGDGTARLWSLGSTDALPSQAVVRESGRCIHGDWVRKVVFPKGRIPVSRSEDGRTIAWGFGEAARRGRKHDFAIKGAVCSDDGRHVLASVDGTNQILYDTADGFRWRVLEMDDFADDVWITRDGMILRAGWDGAVREFDLETLEPGSVYAHSSQRVWNTALSPDQSMFAATSFGEPTVSLWRRGDRSPFAAFLHEHQVRCLEFSPDQALLATACDDGIVRVWSVEEARELWRAEHPGIAWWTGFGPAGDVVGAVGDDGRVALRSASTGEEVAAFEHSCSVSSAAFSPDGRFLAVRLGHDAAPEVWVWALESHEVVGNLGHEDHVHRIEWHPDAKRLATASQDGRVRVFDVPSRTEVIRLTYNGISTCATFVPGTGELLSTSYDGSLELSLVEPEELVARVRTRVPRQLTPSEWQQYLPDEPQPSVPEPGSESRSAEV